MRWRGLALALAAWGVAAGGAVVASSGVVAAASAAPCAFAPTSVAVVVDFGDGSAVSAVCVPAQTADNGAAVLAARAQLLGTPPPRFDSSGFVCGIDGHPDSGCGEQTGSTYAYWSYWHGTANSWDYSNVGAGGSRIHSDVVEGWRFQPHGAGNPSDPPPNGSPDAASTCAPATTATTATSVPAEETSTTSEHVSPSTTVSSATTTSTSTTVTTSTVPTTVAASSSQVAAGPVRVTTPSHSSPWPAVATGGAIVALGATGFVVARRRRGPPGS